MDIVINEDKKFGLLAYNVAVSKIVSMFLPVASHK